MEKIRHARLNIMQKNISLKLFSRLCVGGRAKYFALITTKKQLFDIVHFINDKSLPWYIIGFGSNVIIDDADFNGIVIKLTGEFKKVFFEEDNVSCGAGFSLIQLGQLLASKGFSGYEYMSVIPGSVGGAVLMNAGTTDHGVTSDHFICASVLDPVKETVVEYKKEAMAFAERFTALQNSHNIVLNAGFRLDHDHITSYKQVKLTISNILKHRLAIQPNAKKTFGSTFKNPSQGKPAGWYLERVGMKGFKIGDALVTHEHANWIVNLGNAKAAEVKAIIDVAQKRVFEDLGITLEREVIYLPEDVLK